METGQKKPSPRELFTNAAPALKRRLATCILLSYIDGKKPECEGLLKEAATALAIETRDPKLRFEAKSMLRELGHECDSVIFNAAVSLTPKMLERFADLAMLDLEIDGLDALLGATVLPFAMEAEDSPEKQIGRNILRSNNQSTNVSIFNSLIKLGIMNVDDNETFLNMQLEISSLRAEQSAPPSASREERPESEAESPKPPSETPEPPEPAPETMRSPSSDAGSVESAPEGTNSATPITCQHELRSALDEAVRKVTASRPQTPVRPQSQNQSPSSPSSHPASSKPPRPPPKKRRRNGTSIIPWEEREELPDIDDAQAFRNAELRNKRMSERVMYKAICVFCFRATGQKALIGDKGTARSLVRVNMTRLITNDKPLGELFSECWKKMEQAGAIREKKKKGEHVVSLTNSVSDITNQEIREVVEWALKENRRLST